MFQENPTLEKLLRFGRRVIPKSVFRALQPIYHWGLSIGGAVAYRFPSRSMKVIGVTGTHGKSTTVYMITQILQALGEPVAAIGSLEFRIKDKSWPNSLKMTMPGRLKLQKFLSRARSAGCKYVVLEVTSEGMKQLRQVGVKFDCAVFTNLAKEHIESHGSFENYLTTKQKLFRRTRNIHVLNQDDPHLNRFSHFPAKQKVLFGLNQGDVTQSELELKLKLSGDFNIYNALAALAVVKAYGLDIPKAQIAIESIASVPGRMEFVQLEPFGVVVDYAHTPHALEAVYKTLKKETRDQRQETSLGLDTKQEQVTRRLICVFGATGGGRDKWKRPVFGEVADKYCDEIILTNDDPYDEDQQGIIQQIQAGIKDSTKVQVILDRGKAIKTAIEIAEAGDCVVITGKGSEDRIVFAHGQKLLWSDKEEVKKALENILFRRGLDPTHN